MGKIYSIFIMLMLLPGFCSAMDDRVNFVFIVTDDLGIQDLGCYGSEYYETPHLDKLASQGIRFTEAYASASVCSPTRASILTGAYPHRLQLTDALPWDRLYKNPKLVPPDHIKELSSTITTYPQVLKKAGYRTALIGKWHLGNEHEFFKKKKHLNYGFDEAFDRNGKDKGVEALTAKSIAFIKRNKEKPFFLTLMHHTPHVPLTCPKEYKDRFAKKKPGRFQKNPTYAGMISHLDDSTGKILSTLESLGIAEKTVVVFCSDNGGLNKITSNRPYRGAKGNLYEGGIRVPLIVRWPQKIKPGQTSDAQVLSSDFFPTFLELAGLDLLPKVHLDGISFVPALSGKSISSRPLFWHFPHRGTPSSAVIKDDWKLIHFIESQTYELYNLKKDPSERKDLFQTQKEKSIELKALLEDHLQETSSQRMYSNPSWNEKQPKGKAVNYGVFYPANGKLLQPVKKPYPSWFKSRK